MGQAQTEMRQKAREGKASDEAKAEKRRENTEKMRKEMLRAGECVPELRECLLATKRGKWERSSKVLDRYDSLLVFEQRRSELKKKV